MSDIFTLTASATATTFARHINTHPDGLAAPEAHHAFNFDASEFGEIDPNPDISQFSTRQDALGLPISTPAAVLTPPIRRVASPMRALVITAADGSGA